MTKFICDTNYDLSIFMQSLDYNLKLLFGSNQEVIDQTRQLFLEKVSKVKILKFREKGIYIGKNNPGITTVSDSKIMIELSGFTNSNYLDFIYLRHVFLHEINHALIEILTDKYQKNSYGIKVDANGENCIHTNYYGELQEINILSKKKTNYGVIFHETMVNILATMSAILSDKECMNKNRTVDQVLLKNISNFNSLPTEYSLFESITKLFIWGFSNDGLKQYYHESGILELAKNKSNDFIYGILADHLYIEKIFDKFMGQNSYKKICQIIDEDFYEFRNKRVLPKRLINDIDYIANELTTFVIKKNDYCVKHNIYSQLQANMILNNYKSYLKILKKECNMFLSSNILKKFFKNIKK